jgi:hypothetical protein
MGTNVRFIITLVSLLVLSLVPSVGRAQDTVVAMPIVLANDVADRILAQELDTTLRRAAAEQPGWVLSNFDIPLVEIIRACNGEVVAPPVQCLIRMVAARDPVAATGYVIFAILARRGEGDAARLILTIRLFNVATSLTHQIEVPVERIVSLAERNRLADDWMARLARLVEPAPVAPVIPVAATGENRIVTILGLETADGDDNLALVLTRSLRTHARNVQGWSVSPSAMLLAQFMPANNCDSPTPECLRTAAVNPGSGATGDIIIFGRLRRIGEGASMVMHLELALFDATAGRITHRVSRDMTVENIMTSATRSTIAEESITQLTSDAALSEETPVPGNPHRALEIGGGIMIGVGAVSAVLAVVFGEMVVGIDNDARFEAYRDSWDAARVPDVCVAATNDPSAEGRYAVSRCSAASTYELLTPVFWGLAGGLVTAGVFMLWHPTLSSDTESPSLTLLPSFGPNGGGLSATARF